MEDEKEMLGNGDQEWGNKNVYGVTLGKRWHNQPNIDPPSKFIWKHSALNFFFLSDLRCDKQRQRHFSLLRRGLDVVPFSVLPRPQGRHPRPRPPPLLPHHHRHHPPQLHHDDPAPHRTDRIYRVSLKKKMDWFNLNRRSKWHRVFFQGPFHSNIHFRVSNEGDG